MCKDKLFAYYISKNPSLAHQLEAGKVTLTASGFRKFFNTTYDEGYKQGFNQEPDTDEDGIEDECPTINNDAFRDLLNIFGMR